MLWISWQELNVIRGVNWGIVVALVPFKCFPLTYGISNGSALCKMKLALPFQRVQKMKFQTCLEILLNIGCVQLASLCRPRGAHSGESLTRANWTITHHLVVTSCTRSTSRALGGDPGEPLECSQSYSNIHVPGADRGRPRFSITDWEYTCSTMTGCASTTGYSPALTGTHFYSMEERSNNDQASSIVLDS